MNRSIIPLLCLTLLLLVSSASAAEPTKQQCISANEDGQDLRRTGKPREASERFGFCSAASCPSLLREDCVARLKDAQRAIPTIVFLAKDPLGGALGGIKVTMDGAPLAARLDGSAISVEPGEHTFELVADGYAPVSKKLVVQEGVKGREEVVLFESSKPKATAPAPASAPNAQTALTSDAFPQRTLAYVVGGAGIVGLGLGTVFGVLSKATYDDAISNCGSSSGGVRFCNSAGVAAGDSSNGQATISTIAFVAGTALLAGGIVLLMTAPKERGVSIGLTGAGVRVRGGW